MPPCYALLRRLLMRAADFADALRYAFAVMLRYTLLLRDDTMPPPCLPP